MRIAQVAPLYERVPPKLYGGTERIVSYLTEELVKQGHDVTLFGASPRIGGKLQSDRDVHRHGTCSPTIAVLQHSA